MRLSEFGSTSCLEMSVFQALSAGNGTAPCRSALSPRSAPAIEPYCHAGWAFFAKAGGMRTSDKAADAARMAFICDTPCEARPLDRIIPLRVATGKRAEA